jgi:hypothetical protein
VRIVLASISDTDGRMWRRGSRHERLTDENQDLAARPNPAAAWRRQGLHLERADRVDSTTCGGGRKGPLTCRFTSWSVPVATPRFSMSCGIDTGSPGVGGIQPPFSRPLRLGFGVRLVELAEPNPPPRRQRRPDTRQSRRRPPASRACGPAPGRAGAREAARAAAPVSALASAEPRRAVSGPGHGSPQVSGEWEESRRAGGREGSTVARALALSGTADRRFRARH